MRPGLRRLAVLSCAVLLAAPPGGALAQSAGDDQYADPFGEVDKDKGGSGNSGSGQGGSQGSTGSGATPPTQQTQSQTQSQTGGPAPASPGLPRTGMPAALLAIFGAMLLGGGSILRRRA